MIQQARFSTGISLFLKPFMEYWNVSNYHDVNAPALFAGVYNIDDVNAINNHKGFKVVWNTGAVRDIFKLLNDDIIVFGYGIESMGYKTKRVYIPFRNPEYFKPEPLENCVYAYIGSEKQKETYGYSRIKEIQKHIPYEIIYGKQGHSIEFVKENYYKKSFINLKLHDIGGYTSALEMALMGRFSVGNIKDFPYECDNYYLPFENKNDVIQHILNEGKRIGSTRYINFKFIGNEWKQLKFWQ